MYSAGVSSTKAGVQIKSSIILAHSFWLLFLVFIQRSSRRRRYASVTLIGALIRLIITNYVTIYLFIHLDNIFDFHSALFLASYLGKIHSPTGITSDVYYSQCGWWPWLHIALLGCATESPLHQACTSLCRVTDVPVCVIFSLAFKTSIKIEVESVHCPRFYFMLWQTNHCPKLSFFPFHST